MSRRLQRGTRLVVASHNAGKVREIGDLIAPYGLDAVSAGQLGLPEPEETETTFGGNARLKALACALAANLPALSDDSGMAVAALDGAPGIYSARGAGPAKDFHMAMQRVRDEVVATSASASADASDWSTLQPAATFICALCLAWPDGANEIFEGRLDGHLVWPPRGLKGFGYDPMFVPVGSTQTFGEMDPAAKHAISHRARAFELFRTRVLAAT